MSRDVVRDRKYNQWVKGDFDAGSRFLGAEDVLKRHGEVQRWWSRSSIGGRLGERKRMRVVESRGVVHDCGGYLGSSKW